MCHPQGRARAPRVAQQPKGSVVWCVDLAPVGEGPVMRSMRVHISFRLALNWRAFALRFGNGPTSALTCHLPKERENLALAAADGTDDLPSASLPHASA
jgi:hypothetical protein